ncbi:MAG: efflux RND transporter permease subunit [Candidatus Dormibacteria bacterium]
MLLRRPRLALVVVTVFSLFMGYLGLRLSRFDIAVADTIVDPSSDAFKHEVQYENAFGADPIAVLITGDVRSIFGGKGLQQLIRVEANMSSVDNSKLGVQSLYGPTSIATVSATEAEGALLARVQQAERAAQAKTFADDKAAGQSDADATADANKAATAAGNAVISDAPNQFPEFKQIGLPSADNPAWVSAIFLDASGKPKPRFSSVVPDANHILVTGRLNYGTGESAINRITESVRSDLAKNPIPGATAIVTGVPVLEAAVGHALRLALLAGMLAGALAMTVLLLLALRRQAGVATRLLPLFAGIFTVMALGGVIMLIDKAAIALRAHAGIDAGALQSVLATLSVGFNPATLAALPVALGLGVDYSVQFLYRHYQATAAGSREPLLESRRGAGRATMFAAICTVVGLLALLTSGIPMVRQFGIVMMLGVAIAWLVSRVTVLAGIAVITHRTQVRTAVAAAKRADRDSDDVALFGFVAPAGPVALAGETGDGLRSLAAWVRGHTRQVLVPALVVAGIGWVALPFATYETDPEKLVSPALPAYQDINRVRQVTGSSGEMDFILAGKDVTSDPALKWANDLTSVAARDSNGQFRPAGSLAQLFGAINAGKPLTNAQTKAFMAIVPPYFTDALVSRDHQLGRVAFGIPLQSVSDQALQVQRIINDVDPPAGYTYYPAGFSYLTIKGLETLQAGQLLLNILGAILVLAALFAIYRRRRLALFAWFPTLFVAGWSTAVLFALRAPLTPMTAVLGALVVAFGTEFAILWLERYREAVAGGTPAGAEAAEVATRAAGPGIIVSGSALTLGFLALTVGGLPGIKGLGFDLPMVRDFGLVAAMDMVLALVASLVVLPAAVVRLGLPLPEATRAADAAHGEEPRSARTGAPA